MAHAQSGQDVRSSHMPEATLLILRNYRKMFNMSTLRTTVFKILLINVVIHVVGIQCETAVIRQTKYGSVLGRLTSLSQKFLGVPFAAPTERWESPKELLPWTGVLNATVVKPMCYQGANCAEVNPVGTCQPEMSEDCLYLNIYTPTSADESSGYAVMLFLHGGGFEFSSGGADIYNGETFVNKGEVILVTTNYRLGAFGFLTTGNGPDDLRGNYGLQDQRQAVKWVNENIKFFGGDASRVTLFGQSAGALSIAIHMTTGKIDSMFEKVILESSPFTIPLKPLPVAVHQGEVFSRLLNCTRTDVACLRSRSADEIARKQGEYFQQAAFADSYMRKFLPWLPHIDGTEVKLGVMDAIKNGSFVAKPTIIGTVSQEGAMYVPLAFGRPMSTLEFSMLLFGVTPRLAQKAFQNYRPLNPADSRPELAVLVTDFMFACPARSVARELSKHVPVFSYVFHNVLSVKNVWGMSSHCNDKVCHGAEIPFVFQSAIREPFIFSQEEFKLSNSIVHYWTTFAKTGSPNRFKHYGAQIWPPYNQQGLFPEISIVLNAERGNFLTQDYRGEPCDFWDQMDYKARK